MSLEQGRGCEQMILGTQRQSMKSHEGQELDCSFKTQALFSRCTHNVKRASGFLQGSDLTDRLSVTAWQVGCRRGFSIAFSHRVSRDKSEEIAVRNLLAACTIWPLASFKHITWSSWQIRRELAPRRCLPRLQATWPCHMGVRSRILREVFSGDSFLLKHK